MEIGDLEDFSDCSSISSQSSNAVNFKPNFEYWYDSDDSWNPYYYIDEQTKKLYSIEEPKSKDLEKIPRIKEKHLRKKNKIHGPMRFSKMFQWMFQQYKFETIESSKREEFSNECVSVLSEKLTAVNEYKSINKFLSTCNSDPKSYHDVRDKGQDLFFEFYNIFFSKLMAWIVKESSKEDYPFLVFYAKFWKWFVGGWTQIEDEYLLFYQNILGKTIFFDHVQGCREAAESLGAIKRLWRETFFHFPYCIVSVPLTIRSLMQREWDGEKDATKMIPSDIISSYESYGIHCAAKEFLLKYYADVYLFDVTPLKIHNFLKWHVLEYPMVHRNRFVTVLVEIAIVQFTATKQDIEKLNLDVVTSQRKIKRNAIYCKTYRRKTKQKTEEKKKRLQECIKENKKLKQELEHLLNEFVSLKTNLFLG